MNVLIFVYTEVDIHIFLTHTRVLRYTVHHTGLFGLTQIRRIGHVILVEHRQRRVRDAGVRRITGSEVVIHRRRVRLRNSVLSYRQAADGIDICCFIRLPNRHGIQSGFRQFPCRKVRSSCPFGDIISHTARYGLLMVSPSLVSRDIKTCLEPIGILHVSIDTGYERRLLEVRSVGSGINTIDDGIIITIDV